MTITEVRPTLRAVAAAAGVSIATVSYVMNRRDITDKRITITSETRARVIAAADQIGYVPNHSARVMRLGRTDQICLSVGQLGTPWAQAMTATVGDVGRRLGKSTVALLDEDWYGFLARQGADAAVIQRPMTEDDLPRVRQLAKRGVVLILIDSPVKPQGYDVVLNHPGRAYEQLCRDLVSRHRRVAFFSRHEDPAQSNGFAAYTAAHAAAGRGIDPDLVRVIGGDRTYAYQLALQLLRSKDRPTAICAANDLSAISTVHAAHRLGISIPDEVEIVGTGNTPEGQQLDPALTSVGSDEVFDTIAHLLISRLTGSGEPRRRTHRMDWSVHYRATTVARTTRSTHPTEEQA